MGEHEWADGECLHGPLTGTEAHKACLGKDSKTIGALQNVVMDPRFIKTLHHYVTFRYWWVSLSFFHINCHTLTPTQIWHHMKPKDTLNKILVLITCHTNTTPFNINFLLGIPVSLKILTQTAKICTKTNWFQYLAEKSG